MADGDEEDKAAPDPGGIQAAVDRYRDIAKYIITIFAAIGGLLVAGTQLSSIGKLSIEDDTGRFLAAAVAMAVAILAVVWILHEAIGILKPVEMSLADILASPSLKADIDARPSLLAGAADIPDLQSRIGSPLLSDEEREEWLLVADGVVGRAAYVTARSRFDDAWTPMLVAALLGAAAIAVFAWAANPPASATAGPVVKPAPVELTFELTDAGKDTLREALGERCVEQPIEALSIGGKQGAPAVVTLPTADCKAVQFVLASELGAAIATKPAPAR